ncbi:putative transcription factor B3-Domain family [Helianthus debilis subsp. tardiflorus]
MRRYRKLDKKAKPDYIVEKQRRLKLIQKIMSLQEKEKIDWLPVEVAKRSGLTKKLHSLKIKTLDGKMMENEVETEKNGDVPRYKMVKWGNFMSANSLKNGDILHFNFVTSTDGVNKCGSNLSHVEGW